MSKTENNLKEAFSGEAKAYLRLLFFAEKAEKEGYKQIATLFRAVAEAEKVHARNYLRHLKIVRTTEENLLYSFEKEKFVNEVAYSQMIKNAMEEEDQSKALLFSRYRNVEEGHSNLYKKALQHLIVEKEVEYYICGVCGYTSDGILPEECPICGAPKDVFKKIS